MRLRLLLSLAMLAAEAACFSTRLAQSCKPVRAGPITMAKKSKKDPRVWLPKRSSPFAREVDVALQLVSRAASAVRAEVPIAVTNVAAQTLVCDGLLSEFASDSIIAPARSTTAEADTLKAAIELINEIGATTPCVNAFEPPYPDAVAPTQVSEADVGATLDKGAADHLGPRTWVCARAAQLCSLPPPPLALVLTSTVTYA